MEQIIKSYDDYIRDKIEKITAGEYKNLREAAQFEKDTSFLVGLYKTMNSINNSRVMESVAEDVRSLIINNLKQRINQLTPEELEKIAELNIEVRHEGEVVKLQELATEKNLQMRAKEIYNKADATAEDNAIINYYISGENQIYTVNERIQIAAVSTNEYILDILSQDNNESVRMEVAHNANTSSETLKNLAMDERYDVRQCVAHNLYENNKSLQDPNIRKITNELIQDEAGIAFDINAYLNKKVEDKQSNDRYIVAGMDALWIRNMRGSGNDVNRHMNDTREKLYAEAKSNTILRLNILHNEKAHKYGLRYGDGNLSAIEKKEANNTKEKIKSLNISNFHKDNNKIIADINIDNNPDYQNGSSFYMADAFWTIYVNEEKAWAETTDLQNEYDNDLIVWTTVCGINTETAPEIIANMTDKSKNQESLLNEEIEEIFGTEEIEDYMEETDTDIEETIQDIQDIDDISL